MSHYTVLVVGEDVEAQLAPYDENLQVAPYRRYADSRDLALYAEVYAEAHDGKAHESWQDVATFLTSHWGEEYLYEPEGGIYEMTTYNPHAKWDWYEFGGRWCGYFLLKQGAKTKAMVGPSGAFDNQPRYDSDVCEKGDVDFEAMRHIAGEQAGKEWDRVQAVVGHLPEAESWLDVLARFTDSEGETDSKQARSYYKEQPRVKEAIRHDEGKPWGEKILGFDGGIEQYQVSRELYVQEARDNAIATYAYVLEGEWHAPGKMGWFGSSDDTRHEKRLFVEQFNKMLDELPDDTVLTIVDCHI